MDGWMDGCIEVHEWTTDVPFTQGILGTRKEYILVGHHAYTHVYQESTHFSPSTYWHVSGRLEETGFQDGPWNIKTRAQN